MARDEGKVLRKEAYYPYPPEQVWVALTDPRAIAEWLMPNNFKPVVGHRFEFRVDPTGTYSGMTECEVLEVEPPRRLAYTWAPPASNTKSEWRGVTTVRWTLTREGEGTRLVFEHIGIEKMPLTARLMMNLGWGTMVKKWIPRVAANARPDGTFTPGAIPLENRYYKVKTIPAEFVR